MSAMPDWTEEYKARVRHMMERKGVPVEFNPRPLYEGDEVSTYGWIDSEARDHCRDHDKYCRPDCDWHDDCEWVVPAGALLVERTYSQFTDTVSDNKEEVGVNVSPAHCACGKYSGVTLRYTASFSEVLREILGDGKKPRVGIEL